MCQFDVVINHTMRQDFLLSYFSETRCLPNTNNTFLLKVGLSVSTLIWHSDMNVLSSLHNTHCQLEQILAYCSAFPHCSLFFAVRGCKDMHPAFLPWILLSTFWLLFCSGKIQSNFNSFFQSFRDKSLY